MEVDSSIDRLVEGSALLFLAVIRPDTGVVLASRVTSPAMALRTFRVQKILGTDVHAFPLQVSCAVARCVGPDWAPPSGPC